MKYNKDIQNSVKKKIRNKIFLKINVLSKKMIELIFNEYMCKQTTKQIEDKFFFTKQFFYILTLWYLLPLNFDPYLALFLVMTCYLTCGNSHLVRMNGETTKTYMYIEWH